MKLLDWVENSKKINYINCLIWGNPNAIDYLEKVIEMGFKEGFTMGLNQLETLLSTLKK